MKLNSKFGKITSAPCTDSREPGVYRKFILRSHALVEVRRMSQQNITPGSYLPPV
jgi:hypothetical protein